MSRIGGLESVGFRPCGSIHKNGVGFFRNLLTPAGKSLTDPRHAGG
jgi:hypothetical protein